MSLIHHHLRTLELANLKRKESDQSFLRRFPDMQNSNARIEPIVDMSSALNKVRQSRTTTPRSLVNATNSKTTYKK